MTYDESTVVHRDAQVDRPATAHRSPAGRSNRDRAAAPSPSRMVVLLFGIVQVLIILRIVLLMLDAREGNDLVAFILNTSQIFVGPFEGMLRTDALSAGGSLFDVAAVLALVGWTLLEGLILAAVGVFRRETA